MKNYELLERLIEILGVEEVLNSLVKALSLDEINDNLEYIARVHDIEE